MCRDTHIQNDSVVIQRRPNWGRDERINPRGSSYLINWKMSTAKFKSRNRDVYSEERRPFTNTNRSTQRGQIRCFMSPSWPGCLNSLLSVPSSESVRGIYNECWILHSVWFHGIKRFLLGCDGSWRLISLWIIREEKISILISTTRGAGNRCSRHKRTN